jgi:hypothetical protein
MENIQSKLEGELKLYLIHQLDETNIQIGKWMEDGTETKHPILFQSFVFRKEWLEKQFDSITI